MCNRIEMKISEEVIKNSVILWTENQTGHHRDYLESEILYNEHHGFHSNAFLGSSDRSVRCWNQQELINSVAFYLMQEHHFKPEEMNIELFWSEEEGFTAGIIIE
jgi:hypothetical protein